MSSRILMFFIFMMLSAYGWSQVISDPGWKLAEPSILDADTARDLFEKRSKKRKEEIEKHEKISHAKKPSDTSIASFSAKSGELNGTGAPASISEMARALNYDPDLIYRFVHDNIEFYPIWGVQKGALGALIDGSGTEFDIAMLMVELINANPALSQPIAELEYGRVRLTRDQVGKFFCIESSELNKAAWIPLWLIYNGKFIASMYTTTDQNPDTPLRLNEAMDVDHVWVKVNIDGTIYHFDPSYKEHTSSAKIDIASAMGFDKATFMSSGSGGATQSATVTSDYIKNINRTNIRSRLNTYSSNLISYLRTNAPSADLHDVLGGWSIVTIDENVSIRNSAPPLPLAPGNQPSMLGIENYKPSLRVQYLGIDEEFTSDELMGRRLVLRFNTSNYPEIYLDGGLVATGTSIAVCGANPVNCQASITFIIEHRAFATSAVDQTASKTIKAGGTYAIANGWGGSSRGIADLQRSMLAQLKADGLSDDSEPVLGTSLQIMANTWLAESSKVEYIFDQIGGTKTIRYHLVGISGFAPNSYGGFSPYVDLPAGIDAITSLSYIAGSNPAAYDYKRPKSIFHAQTIHNSVLESSTVEQTTSVNAISTAKFIDLMAQVSNSSFYTATPSNYTAGSNVRSLLISAGCTIAQADLLASYISSFGRVVVPVKPTSTGCSLLVNNWSGHAFYALADSKIGALINGDFLTYGGAGTTSATPEVVTDTSESTNIFSIIYGFAAKLFGDPVDHFRGNYIYSHDDIVLGNGDPFPYTLSFQRTYNSGSRLEKTALGNGFSHNFDVAATQATDGFQVMGEDSPIDAASTLVEMYVAFQLLDEHTEGQSDAPVSNIVAANIGVAWWAEQLWNGAVSVKKGASSELFVKLSDGTYNPPPNNNAKLSLVSGAYKYETPDKIALNFRTDGKISNWTSPAGPVVTFTYDSSTPAKLQTVSNNMGRTLTLSYNGDLISGVSDGNSRSVSYAYDSNSSPAHLNNLLSYTDTLGFATTMEYSGQGQLFKMFYPEKPTVPFVTNYYDTLGRVKEQRDPNNKLTQYFFAGSRSELINPLGQSTVYYNNPLGSILTETNALGETITRDYDGLNRLVAETYPEGNSVAYTYNSNNDVLTATRKAKSGSGLADTVTTFTYYTGATDCKKVNTITDDLGRVTTFAYDHTKCNVTSITQPDPGSGAPVTQFTSYNTKGQLLSKTDPEGIVTKYTYHATKETLSNVVVDFGGLGLMTQYAYTGFGALSQITDPLGNVTQITNDAQRQKTWITGPDPDGAGSLLPPSINNVYDKNGNIKMSQVRKASGVWLQTNITYTNSDQKSTVTDPLGNATTFGYDDMDRVDTVTDAMGRVSKTTYDNAGRIASRTTAFGTADARGVGNTYYTNGKLHTITDSLGNVTTYTYDGFDRLKKADYANGKNEQYTYDDVDNSLTWKTRSGTTITYGYDALNRRTSKTIPGQATTTYGYDGLNRMTSASYTGSLSAGDAALGNWTLAYDHAGRLSSASRPDGKTVGYQYDNNSNRTRVTYPDNWYAQYGYDNTNRLKTIQENGTGTALGTLSWDNISRYTGVSYANGASDTLAWDNGSRMYSHTFNLTGTNTVNFAYEYNNANQRNKTTASDITYLWTPAASSNTSYTANSVNQYVGGYQYDNNGNMTFDGVFTYGYDAENRMVSAVGNGKTLSFKYDPFGRRYSKTVNGTTTLYLHDGTREIAEYNGATLSARHIFSGDDSVLATIKGTDYLYYHKDIQGSVVALTDAARNLRGQVTYSPYGESGNIAPAASFGYTGQRYDGETGLYYYKARYYSPKLGRFMSNDPIGYKDNLNLYAYTGNDPLNYTDPWGLEALVIVGDNKSNPTFFTDIAQHNYPDAKIVQADSISEFNDALRETSDITSLTYLGHSDSGALYLSFGNSLTSSDVYSLDTSNISEGAQITLMSCHAAEGGNNSIAADFANHFNKSVTAYETGVSFGWSLGGILPFSISPYSPHNEGSFSNDTVTVQPKK